MGPPKKVFKKIQNLLKILKVICISKLIWATLGDQNWIIKTLVWPSKPIQAFLVNQEKKWVGMVSDG